MESFATTSISLLLLSILFTQTPTYSQQLEASDSAALLSFKSLATTGAALESWNNSTNLCEWRGVNCSDPRQPNRVTDLMLGSLGLDGTISPSLGNLTFLTTLNLSYNSLQGGIPSDLGRCQKLEFMILNDNKLASSIPPELGSLPKLQRLQLSNNNLTGTIPPSIGNLLSLTDLQLSFNNLEGSIPSEIGAIPGLLVMDLRSNGLSGKIPSALFNFSVLYGFDVSGNNLSGELPKDFGQNLPQLMYLNLYDNFLEGPLPSSITNATLLEWILISNNSFSGQLPPTLGSLKSLSRLQISQNKFEASEDWSFLTSLTNCANLEIVDLSVNAFRGSLPDSIGNLSTKLSWLRIRENRISGRIPPGIGKLSGLSVIDMESNLFSGPIPDSLGTLPNLQAFSVRDNKLSGEIPASLGNLTQMLEFYLSQNSLSGTIPESLAALQKLSVFDLSHNNLSGTIPKGVLGISSVSTYLNFSHNSFVGPLPDEVGKLVNLKALDVSENKFSGRIPSSLSNCLLLEYLNLEGNQFGEDIPNLSNLKGLQSLYLSSNQLTGQIPEFLTDLSLKHLNLSFNNLEGEVPTKGVFANSKSFSVQGNQKLCGGNSDLNLRSCSINKKGLSRTVIIIIVVIAVAICCLFVLFCLVRNFASKKKPRSSSSLNDPQNDTFLKISYADLVKATNEFSSENQIGSGSFGVVYKGFLEQQRIEVAVKVLDQSLNAASKSFMAECNVLRNIRHRHLLRIITSCSTMDFKGNDFKALVYEFIPNGNLDKWLHTAEDVDSKLGSLNLSQRINIAIDVASALNYLHNEIETPIVHCDLKPSNVLLDYDMTAYVGDFGISRFLSTDIESTTIGIKGTYGYIAPECGVGTPVSTSWDVYSYGILLLEMFTGRRPTDEAFGDNMNLHKYVEMNFPNKVMDIIDPKLLPQGTDKESDKIRVCLSSVLRVALNCTKESHGERMRTQDILKHFEAIKDLITETEGQAKM